MFTTLGELRHLLDRPDLPDSLPVVVQEVYDAPDRYTVTDVFSEHDRLVLTVSRIPEESNNAPS